MSDKEPLDAFQIIGDAGPETTLFEPTEDEIRELCVKHEVDPDEILKFVNERGHGVHTVIVNVAIYKAGKEAEKS